MSRLLLLSGGLDSTAVAAMTRPDQCLTIDYGQVAAQAEAQAAKQIATLLGLKWNVITVPAREVGAGLMTGTSPDPQAPPDAAPEWWPFRNQLLITLAAAWGVTRGITVVEVGTVASDGARHLDGTSLFLEAIDRVVASQEGHIRVRAPAARLEAVELLTRSPVTEDVLAWTHSCHRANLPCGACPGCTKRRETLAAVGLLQ